MGYRLRSPTPKDKSKVQNRAGQNRNQRFNRLFNEYFLPKRNTYHNQGEFFWTKQAESETPEDLAEIDRNLKRMQLRKHNSRRITHFQIYDRNYGQETSRQIIERKKPEMKKAIKTIKQNTYEKKNNENTIPEALISNRKKSRKNQYREWTNSTHGREINSTTTDHADFAMHQTGAKLTNAQHWTRHAITAERKATLHGHADKKKITNAKYGM